MYGASTYGTAREGGSYSPPGIWTLDTWGQNLVGCLDADGRIWEWALNTGTPAAVVANAPTNNLGILVTEERHLMALGAGGNPRNPRRPAWSVLDRAPCAEMVAGGGSRRGTARDNALTRPRARLVSARGDALP